MKGHKIKTSKLGRLARLLNRSLASQDAQWVEYWFVRSFACSALLASLPRSAALICSLASSLTLFGAHGKNAVVYEFNALILYNFSPLCGGFDEPVNSNN